MATPTQRLSATRAVLEHGRAVTATELDAEVGAWRSAGLSFAAINRHPGTSVGMVPVAQRRDRDQHQLEAGGEFAIHVEVVGACMGLQRAEIRVRIGLVVGRRGRVLVGGRRMVRHRPFRFQPRTESPV